MGKKSAQSQARHIRLWAFAIAVACLAFAVAGFGIASDGAYAADGQDAGQQDGSAAVADNGSARQPVQGGTQAPSSGDAGGAGEAQAPGDPDGAEGENGGSGANGGDTDGASADVPEADGDGEGTEAEGVLSAQEDVDYAASIGSEKFETVQAAIDAANAGDTVTVLADFDETIAITKAITLDLNGHAYRHASTSDAAGITVSGGHIVATIKNGTVTGCTTASQNGYAIRTKQAGVNLIDIAFTQNSGSGYLVYVYDPYGATTEMKWENTSFSDNSTAGVASIRYAAGYSFSGCKFENNTVTSSSCRVVDCGGKGTPVFSRCTFADNSGSGSYVISALDLTMENCTVSGNTGFQCAIYASGYNRGNITLTGCTVTGNSVTESTVFSKYMFDPPFADKTKPKLVLVDSVVKGNTSSGSGRYNCAGIYSNYWGTSLSGSAVYGNESTGGGSRDFAFWALEDTGSVPDDYLAADTLKANTGIDVSAMKDPTDPGKNFSNYSIDTATGEVIETVPVYEAQIGDVQYKTFADAWAAATAADAPQESTITVTVTDSGGNAVDLHPITDLDAKGKDVTIDLNGRGVTANSGNTSFSSVAADKGNAGSITVVNNADAASALYGYAWVSNDSDVTFGDGVELQSLLYVNQGNAKFAGSHDNVHVVFWSHAYPDQNKPVGFDDGFAFTGDGTYGHVFAFDWYNKDDLADPGKQVGDIAIATGLSEEEAAKATLVGITSPLVTLVTNDGTTSVHKDQGAIVYLDGEHGDDGNDGTSKGAAVKTFAKASELAAKAAKDAGTARAYVYVCGTVAVDGSQEWSSPDGASLTLLRYPGESSFDDAFKGALVSVSGSGASLSLSNIVLDGNGAVTREGNGDHLTANAPLVSVANGAALTVGEGAALQNNRRGDLTYMNGLGGGIYADHATVDVTGGTVKGNTALWGGGIYGSASTINIAGGSVSGNSAASGTDKTPAFGGGVAGWYGTKVNLSGGSVSDNRSAVNGGGISVGVSYKVDSNTAHDALSMTGGTVSGNVAEGNGGGISVWNGTDANYATASISGGSITGNTARAATADASFAGGGIYVNGTSEDGYHNGELAMGSALITGNSASDDGGGIAACPTSTTTIGAGAAIVQNEAGGSGNGIFIMSSKTAGSHMWGEATYSVPARLPGGAAYNWQVTDFSGNVVQDAALSGTLAVGNGATEARAFSTDAAAGDYDTRSADVVISGNTSGSRGGGIGSNGIVVIGQRETAAVSIAKEWEAGDHPDSVTVDLYRTNADGSRDLVEGDIVLDADNSWSAQVTGLPVLGDGCRYTVEEQPVSGWAAHVSEAEFHEGDGDSAASYTITITNKKVTPVSIDPPVTKVIAGQTPGSYPEFTFTMTARDGAPMPQSSADGKTATVTLQSASAPVSGEFGTITFDAPGTYVYDIAEAADSPAEGWAYDTSLFTLTVTVTEEDGALVADQQVEKSAADGTGTVPSDAAVFVNSYQTRDVSVTKVWDDSDDADGLRPGSVTVRLLANGKDTGKTLELNAGNQWKAQFTGLPIYSDGEAVTYTVAEDAVEGYEAPVISGDAASGFVVTNKHAVSDSGGSGVPGGKAGKSGRHSPLTGDEARTLALVLGAAACASAACAVASSRKRRPAKGKHGRR